MPFYGYGYTCDVREHPAARGPPSCALNANGSTWLCSAGECQYTASNSNLTRYPTYAQVGYDDILPLLAASPTGRQWDPVSSTPWFNVRNGSQQWSVYEDNRSLALKAAAVRAHGLRGIGMWLGDEANIGEGMWEALLPPKEPGLLSTFPAGAPLTELHVAAGVDGMLALRPHAILVDASDEASSAAVKTDDMGEAGPGLSIGTAFKGCQKQCWLNATTQNLWPFDSEITVFEHDCKAATGCKMHHLWTGGTWPGYQNSRVRYYVDHEHVASVDFPLGLGAGSSMLEDVNQLPFSAGDLFGWTGLRAKGGAFNTYQVPFVKSVRVTVELLTTQPAGMRQHDPVGFWLILRGTDGGSEGSAVRLPGGVLLPPSASFRSFENTEVSVAGGSTLDLLRSGNDQGRIAVLMVSLAVSSKRTGLSFLEGCLRANSGTNSALQLLSSGTEDLFLGTFYFESGLYANALAGATRVNRTHGAPSCVWDGAASGEPACTSLPGASFSAYRVLGGADPLVLSTPATVSWRNGDSPGCDLSMPGGTYPVNVSSVVFYYEYGLSGSRSLKSDDDETVTWPAGAGHLRFDPVTASIVGVTAREPSGVTRLSEAAAGMSVFGIKVWPSPHATRSQTLDAASWRLEPARSTPPTRFTYANTDAQLVAVVRAQPGAEQLDLSLEIASAGPHTVHLAEVLFPRLSNLSAEADSEIAWSGGSRGAGLRLSDPVCRIETDVRWNWLRTGFAPFFQADAWPHAAMSWVSWATPSSALYVGVHDTEFRVTALLAQPAVPNKSISLGFTANASFALPPGATVGTNGAYRRPVALAFVSDAAHPTTFAQWSLAAMLYRRWLEAAVGGPPHHPLWLRQGYAAVDISQDFPTGYYGERESEIDDPWWFGLELLNVWGWAATPDCCPGYPVPDPGRGGDEGARQYVARLHAAGLRVGNYFESFRSNPIFSLATSFRGNVSPT